MSNIKASKFKKAGASIREKFISIFPEYDKRSDIDFIYDKHPELSGTGNKELYSEYIKTIFPNSIIQQILFHGGNKGITTFAAPLERRFKNKTIGSGTKDYGIYFTGTRALAVTIGKVIDGQTYPVILNIKNPLRDNGRSFIAIRKILGIKNTFDGRRISTKDYNKFIASKRYDSVVWRGESNEVIVFDPKQIHILGSKNDIQKFSMFLEQIREKEYQKNSYLR